MDQKNSTLQRPDQDISSLASASVDPVDSMANPTKGQREGEECGKSSSVPRSGALGLHLPLPLALALLRLRLGRLRLLVVGRLVLRRVAEPQL